jgi:2-iminobutanoate/2-iminopropanoate deaminase
LSIAKAQEDEMNRIAKIGWTSILAGGLAILAFQGGHAQTGGRNYVYSKNPSSKGLPFSEAVLVGDTLYVAGHIGVDQKTGQAPGDLDQEMKLLFDGVRADMAEVNFGMDDLVSVRIYCTDLALYGKFNTAYRAQFGKDVPARAFVGVASLLRNGHFEMEGVAVKAGH